MNEKFPINPPDRPPLPRDPVADEALQRPDWTVRQRETQGVLALDKNENTDSGLQRLIAEVIAGVPISASLEYPECAPYYDLLADHLGVVPANLLFTAGSDGAIRSVFEAFLAPGETVVQTMPSFAMFELYTRMYGGKTHALAYEATAQGPKLEAGKISEALALVRPRIMCLPNPDSPTGTLFQAEDLERIVTAAAAVDCVALIDEAYYPFSSVSALGLIGRYPNLVVARTFAKAWGIAGLRLGFAGAHPEMTALLHKVRPMYEVNGLALAAMAGLIERADEVMAAAARINAGKDYFLARMQSLRLRTLDCAGNFVHVDFGDARDAVHAQLTGKVLYKPSFGDACLASFSRFTTAPEETMAALSDIIEGALNG